MSTTTTPTRPPLRKNGSPRCEDCFFHQNMLCALDLDAPCATFRLAGPEGLTPPRQTTLLVRAAIGPEPEPVALAA